MKQSRRDFIKTAGISALGIGISVFSTEDASAEGKSKYISTPVAKSAKRWAMVIDTRRFDKPDSFERVIEACHREHNVPDIKGPHEVKWIWKDNFKHTFPEEMHEHMPLHVLQSDFLLLCNHCDEPACVRVCPTGATFKNKENGLVVMDPHRCIGCRFCMAGCPYGARSFNFKDPQPYIKEINPQYPARMRGVVEKCTFCAERLNQGKMPACVEASDGAIIFGDLNDPNSNVRKTLASNFTIRRKSSIGTGPGVYYII